MTGLDRKDRKPHHLRIRESENLRSHFFLSSSSYNNLIISQISTHHWTLPDPLPITAEFYDRQVSPRADLLKTSNSSPNPLLSISLIFSLQGFVLSFLHSNHFNRFNLIFLPCFNIPAAPRALLAPDSLRRNITNPSGRRVLLLLPHWSTLSPCTASGKLHPRGSWSNQPIWLFGLSPVCPGHGMLFCGVAPNIPETNRLFLDLSLELETGTACFHRL